MIHALFQLCGMVGEPLPVKRQQSFGRTATRAQAEDMVNLFERLDKANFLPRFTVSKLTLSQMHRAVRLAHSLKLVPSLFPTQLPPSLPPQHDDPLSCFNPLVASNPEQYQAVSAIVSGASGRSIQLRLTCYLHFPCVQGASPTLCLAPRGQARP